MNDKKQIATFTAESADGRKWKIVVFQHFTRGRDLDGTPWEVPGTKSLATSDGRTVTCLSPGQYEILGGVTSIPITSDDPNAL